MKYNVVQGGRSCEQNWLELHEAMFEKSLSPKFLEWIIQLHKVKGWPIITLTIKQTFTMYYRNSNNYIWFLILFIIK